MLKMSVALSVRQPWVELIIQNFKTIEVRTWMTRFRGEMWLHAGARADIRAIQRFDYLSANLTLGAIVGRCDLYDCVEFSPYTWDKWRPQHLNEGPLLGRRYAWLLRDVTRISPVPMKGRLGLMTVNASKLQLGERTWP